MTRQLELITLIVTSKCPLKCAHCGPRSGPDQKNSLSRDDVIRALDEAVLRDTKLVVFTGGEPFLLGGELVAYVEEATSRGLFSRVVTGAYWAVSEETAMRRLSELCNAGLNELNVSTSDEHQAMVPIVNVVTAVGAAQQLELQVAVGIGLKKTSLMSSRTVREAFLSRGQPVPLLIQSKLVPFGRGEESVMHEEQFLRPVEDVRGPCTSMTQHVALQANGRVTGCSAVFAEETTALSFGNTAETNLTEIIDRMDTDPLALFLHRLGPFELKRLIESETDIRFQNEYINICHLCGDILQNDEAIRFLSERGLLSNYRGQGVQEAN